MRGILRVAQLLLLTAAVSLAQQTAGGQGTKTGGSTSGSTTGNKTRGSSSSDENTPQRSASIERTVYQHGVVTLAEGGLPPIDTPVELVCAGGQPAETLTEKDGAFLFKLSEVRGQGSGLWTSDRTSQISARAGGSARTGYTGCRVRVLLKGYRGVRARPRGRSNRMSNRYIRHIDLGSIILYPLDGERGVAVSLTSLEAPSEAAKAHAKASKALAEKPPNPDAAIPLLIEATTQHPSYAAAWTDLGRAHILRKDYASALAVLAKAREADAQYVEIYPRLASVAVELRDWRTAIEAANTWRRLRPGSQAAEYYRAMAAMNLADYGTAEEASLALLTGPDLKKYPHVLYFLGFIEANRGEVKSAAKRFRRLLEAWPEAPMAAEVHARLNEWVQAGKIDAERFASRLAASL